MLSALRKYISEVKRASSLLEMNKLEQIILWDFRKPETMKQWSCICDKDFAGLSSATFEHSPHGYATFSGELSPQIPKTSDLLYSGYAAIRSKPNKKSFWDSGLMDLYEYNLIELCIQGDGRPYIFNIQADGLARKDDIWQYILYTRGGPLWETIRIPFSEFLLTHRGYLQDNEMELPLQNITTFGLLLADKTDGPFKLNIQYIRALRTYT